MLTLDPDTVLELMRQRQDELMRQADRRLAGPGWIVRRVRRLVAAGAMRRDREAVLSRSLGGRV